MDPQLTSSEARLVAALLRRAVETFSNHGCNDFDVCREAGLSPSEADALWKKLGEWDDPELAESEGAIHYDWILMSYFADKIGGPE